MALQRVLFPIDQPVMPEGLQIGRKPAIDRLETELRGFGHQWLIAPRRTGKTSVAKAALERLRQDGFTVIEVDLTMPKIREPEDLAAAIAAAARSSAPALAEVDDDLGDVLAALSATARQSGQRMFMLLDEVHLLDDIDTGIRHVARCCHEDGSPIVFVFAGSEASAVRALRDEGQLAAVGSDFDLPAIAHEDWCHGLRLRFDEAGVEIADDELDRIVRASDGHPRRTMLIAHKTHTSARQQPDSVATPTVVEIAVNEARRDRSW